MYEVEAIINDRWNGRSKRHEWRLNWKEYSAAKATWEPIENLAGAADLLKEYKVKTKTLENARGRRKQPTRKAIRGPGNPTTVVIGGENAEPNHRSCAKSHVEKITWLGREAGGLASTMGDRR